MSMWRTCHSEILSQSFLGITPYRLIILSVTPDSKSKHSRRIAIYNLSTRLNNWSWKHKCHYIYWKHWSLKSKWLQYRAVPQSSYRPYLDSSHLRKTNHFFALPQHQPGLGVTCGTNHHGVIAALNSWAISNWTSVLNWPSNEDICLLL